MMMIPGDVLICGEVGSEEMGARVTMWVSRWVGTWVGRWVCV